MGTVMAGVMADTGAAMAGGGAAGNGAVFMAGTGAVMVMAGTGAVMGGTGHLRHRYHPREMKP